MYRRAFRPPLECRPGVDDVGIVAAPLDRWNLPAGRARNEALGKHIGVGQQPTPIDKQLGVTVSHPLHEPRAHAADVGELSEDHRLMAAAPFVKHQQFQRIMNNPTQPPIATELLSDAAAPDADIPTKTPGLRKSLSSPGNRQIFRIRLSMIRGLAVVVTQSLHRITFERLLNRRMEHHALHEMDEPLISVAIIFSAVPYAPHDSAQLRRSIDPNELLPNPLDFLRAIPQRVNPIIIRRRISRIGQQKPWPNVATAGRKVLAKFVLEVELKSLIAHSVI